MKEVLASESAGKGYQRSVGIAPWTFGKKRDTYFRSCALAMTQRLIISRGPAANSCCHEWKTSSPSRCWVEALLYFAIPIKCFMLSLDFLVVFFSVFFRCEFCFSSVRCATNLLSACYLRVLLLSRNTIEWYGRKRNA